LETDLYNSPVQAELKKYYDPDSKISADDIIKKMKAHKAINMYEFLKKHKDKLAVLRDHSLAYPLKRAEERIEEQYGTY